MHALIERHRDELRALCRQHHVRRLELFGSATGPGFDPQRSDLDFLVEFEALFPGTRAHTYLALHAALKSLFGRKIDLVEIEAVQNPYRRARIEAQRQMLYAS